MGDCRKDDIFSSRFLAISPESGSSKPWMILNRVDFPEPLTPMIPIFSPACSPNVAPEKRTLSPLVFERFLALSRFIRRYFWLKTNKKERLKRIPMIARTPYVELIQFTNIVPFITLLS